MRLGKRKYYFTKPKSELYSDKKVRVLLYEVIKDGKDNLLFTHKDIERLIRDHLENESFNDKNMERKNSDFFLKLHNYKVLLRKIENEHDERMKGGKIVGKVNCTNCGFIFDVSESEIISNKIICPKCNSKCL